MVPARVEINLEGCIITTQAQSEGPYAEWMGYFEEEMIVPIFRVRSITHRLDSLYMMTI